MATLLAALMCLPGRQTNFPVADRDKWAPSEPCGASQTLNRIATNYTQGILYSIYLSLSFSFPLQASKIQTWIDMPQKVRA